MSTEIGATEGKRLAEREKDEDAKDIHPGYLAKLVNFATRPKIRRIYPPGGYVAFYPNECPFASYEFH